MVTAVAGPSGTGYTTTVDTAGHITGFAAAGAGTYTVTWGANGRPAVVNAPAGQGSPQFTSTTYDAAGLPATRTTSDSSVTYGRDPAGRVTTIGAGGNSSIAFTYDASGRLHHGRLARRDAEPDLYRIGAVRCEHDHRPGEDRRRPHRR